MDRQGSLESTLRRRNARVVTAGLCVALLVLSSARSHAQKPAPALRDSRTAEVEAVDRRPYRISLHIGFDPSARIDEAKSVALIREWQVLVRRFIGAPWVVTMAEPSSPLSNVQLDALEA